jgi:hypothetical protein
MTIPRVWIQYEPRLYSEAFVRLFELSGTVEIVMTEPGNGNNQIQREPADWGEVDIAVLSLDDNGRPEADSLPEAPPHAKVLAFSPVGNYGLRRLPGCSEWEVMQPFGVDELIGEICGESDPRAKGA